MPAAAAAQGAGGTRASVAGRVVDDVGAPIEGVLVGIEGQPLTSVTDSAGRYLLQQVPPGTHMLRAERIGFAVARLRLDVPATGTLQQEIRLTERALELETLNVTADAVGRARGELGTATVSETEAIRNQGAASLAGVLELVPGVPLSVPGLDGVQQIALRAAPVSSGAQGAAGASLAGLASFGTLIVLDGVPASNNANLQTLGPRGEQSLGTSANGGIDLRRIPASTIERQLQRHAWIRYCVLTNIRTNRATEKLDQDGPDQDVRT